MKQFYSLGIILLSFCLTSCEFANKDSKQETDNSSNLRVGDLLFQDLDCGPLCDAIEAVTEGAEGRDFSHCAMVVQVGDSLKVVEAIGTEVSITSLADFKLRSNKIWAARLKPKFQHLIPRAAKFAQAQIGKPYDEVFLLNNDRYYCSELIYESFKAANYGKAVFELSPMTFKQPKTAKFFPAWVDYYKPLKCPIPEGKLGLNPGSISRSNSLVSIQIKFDPLR